MAVAARPARHKHNGINNYTPLIFSVCGETPCGDVYTHVVVIVQFFVANIGWNGARRGEIRVIAAGQVIDVICLRVFHLDNRGAIDIITDLTVVYSHRKITCL